MSPRADKRGGGAVVVGRLRMVRGLLSTWQPDPSLMSLCYP
jgi:hypothetical protein